MVVRLALGTPILQEGCLFSQEDAHIYWRGVYFHKRVPYLLEGCLFSQEGAHIYCKYLHQGAYIYMNISTGVSIFT